jgi:hypothetical protein
MNAQTIDLQASKDLTISQTPSAHSQHTDWSFIPTAAGGLTGIAIGLVLGSLFGLC